jgi:hypothetical protein
MLSEIVGATVEWLFTGLCAAACLWALFRNPTP